MYLYIQLAPMSELTRGATLLRSFLDANRISVTAAARAVGVRHPVVLDWLSGAKRPAANARAAIAIWTSGRVYPEAWRTDEEWQALARVQPLKTGTDG